MIGMSIIPHTFFNELVDQRQKRATRYAPRKIAEGVEEGGRERKKIGAARVPNPALKQEYRDNALGSRQALFIMGWTRVLEASGGSGPPKARVLWGPIVTGSVNRRAVSLRSLFAHEPRVVFRDNKRATSSSAGTTTPRSFVHSISLSPTFFLFLLLPHVFFSACDRALIRLVRLARYHPRYILQILLASFVPRAINFRLLRLRRRRLSKQFSDGRTWRIEWHKER